MKISLRNFSEQKGNTQSVHPSSCSSNFLKAGIFLTTANFITGVLSYAFQVLTGRFLTLAEYALFCSLMSIYVLLASPASAIALVVSRTVSNLYALDNFHQILLNFKRIHLKIFIAAILLTLTLAPLQDFICGYLKILNSYDLWILLLCLYAAIFLIINNAFIQGLGKFKLLAILGISAITIKICIGITLILYGFGLSGALLGLLVSSLLSWSIGFRLNEKFLELKLTDASISDNKTHLNYPSNNTIAVIFASISFIAMTQLDMLIVNSLFPPNESGIYAAISTLGKVNLYIPSGFMVVLFSTVSKNHASEKSSANLLALSLLLTTLGCSIISIIYWQFGESIVSIFYGAEYLDAANLLYIYSLSIMPMAYVILAEHFLLAKGRNLFTWIFFAISPLQILAMLLWHQTLFQIIAIIATSNSLVAIIGYVILFKEYFGNNNEQ